MKLFVGAQKCLLHHVLGILFVAGHTKCQTKDTTAVTVHQHAVCVPIARPYPGDCYAVAVFHSPFRLQRFLAVSPGSTDFVTLLVWIPAGIFSAKSRPDSARWRRCRRGFWERTNAFEWGSSASAIAATDLLNQIRACPQHRSRRVLRRLFASNSIEPRSVAPAAAIIADYRRMLDDSID